jgi:hypothetical protein
MALGAKPAVAAWRGARQQGAPGATGAVRRCAARGRAHVTAIAAGRLHPAGLLRPAVPLRAEQAAVRQRRGAADATLRIAGNDRRLLCREAVRVLAPVAYLLRWLGREHRLHLIFWQYNARSRPHA